MEWWKDLCDYYGVSKEEAIQLGIRKTGRKPNFPASKTCQAVGGKNMEEWWESASRDTIQKKMDFYKDIGAWLSFRQCNYRSTFNYGGFFGPYLRNGNKICEYGCGVAPFTNYIVENGQSMGLDINSMKFVLVDVASEPLEFAKWRLRRKVPNINMEIHEINGDYMVPKFNDKFDIICIMDVFEHLPNPYEVVSSLCDSSQDGCIMVETWVDKSDGKSGGPDLEEAEMQKGKTMEILNKKFSVIKSGSIRIRKRVNG